MMNEKNYWWQRILLIFSVGLFAISCVAVPNISTPSISPSNQMISVTELQDLMNKEEFTLVNVHIPLEGNIAGTDAMIPYDEIENHLDQLPADKNAKIVIYCLSGSMSRVAMQTLIHLGYTNVFDLENGYNAWVAHGLPLKE